MLLEPLNTFTACTFYMKIEGGNVSHDGTFCDNPEWSGVVFRSVCIWCLARPLLFLLQSAIDDGPPVCGLVGGASALNARGVRPFTLSWLPIPGLTLQLTCCFWLS